MAPVELLDLRATHSGGKVRMSWRYPPKPPDVVHIYPCTGGPSGPQLNMRGHIEKKLKDCNDGVVFDLMGGVGSDVKKMDFCAFLANPGEDVPEARVLQSMPNSFASVVTGEARISYDFRKSSVKKKTWDRILSQYRIWLQSSAEIEAGLLGYTYFFHGKAISFTFPGAVLRGIVEYPPIYLPLEATPMVELIHGGNTDVSVIRQNFSIIIRWFKRKKYAL